MRILLFTKRNAKEVLRDPINLLFGLGFPLILLALLSLIDASIPAEANNPMFKINNLAPGLAMFGTVFMSLFVGVLLAKDRTSLFLMRLFTSPMKALDFLLGYTAPMLVIVVAQVTITLTVACFFGLSVTINIAPAILITALTSLLFIGIGLLCGCLISDNAVGGVCGALLTNVAGWLSGVFIPINLIGGVLETVSHALPFYHIIEAVKMTLSGDFFRMLPHLAIVLAYTIAVYLIAVLAFRRKMSGGK